MSLVASFLKVVQSLAAVLTAPTFANLLVLLTGWVFARRRTITWMIVAAGAVDSHHISTFHRVFTQAHWSLDALGFAVFELITTRPRVADPVPLSLDDTLVHKRGRHVWGAGMHHDACLSSKATNVLTWGHNWVVLCVIVRLPFCRDRVFSLPILFRLYLNHKAAARWRIVYRTRPELAVQLLHRLCARFPDRRVHVVADATYAGGERPGPPARHLRPDQPSPPDGASARRATSPTPRPAWAAREAWAPTPVTADDAPTTCAPHDPEALRPSRRSPSG